MNGPHRDLDESALSAYLDGETDARERGDVEARLVRDPEWQAVLVDVRFARDAVRALPWRAPPEGFLDALLAAPARRHNAFAVIGAAAAVIAALVLAVPANRQRSVTPQVRTMAARAGTMAAQSDVIGDVHAPYRDPQRVGDGFQLRSRVAAGRGEVQLVYSDGSVRVYVFEEPGRVDWSAMPRADTASTVAGHRAWRYELGVGEAWVFERGGVVYVCVGDAPSSELSVIARDVSAPSDSALARVARVLLGPFRW